MSRIPLTPRQQETLDFVVGCALAGLPPTRREIARHFGLSPSTVQKALVQLDRKHYITIHGSEFRGITIAEDVLAEAKKRAEKAP